MAAESPDASGGVLHLIDPFRDDKARSIGEGREPAWSPDGRRLAFEDASGALVVRDLATATHVAVGQGSTGGGGRTHSCPAWSPDGSLIATGFTSFEDEGGEGFEGELNEVRIYRADGSGLLSKHGTGADGSCPRWSPDGTRLVFEQDRTIHTIRPDGTGDRAVTSAPCAWDTDPDWSASGLLYSRTVPDRDQLPTTGIVPSDCVGEDQTGIWTITDAGSAQQLIATERDAYDLRWASNGAAFAYTTTANEAPDAPLEVWVGREDGSHLRVSTPSRGHTFWPAFASDVEPAAVQPTADTSSSATTASAPPDGAQPTEQSATSTSTTATRTDTELGHGPDDAAQAPRPGIKGSSDSRTSAIARIAAVLIAATATALALRRRRSRQARS